MTDVDRVPVADMTAAPDRFGPLAGPLALHTSLAKALAWWYAQTPPLAPGDIVGQDEFSYDILVPWPGGWYLSYDTS